MINLTTSRRKPFGAFFMEEPQLLASSPLVRRRLLGEQAARASPGPLPNSPKQTGAVSGGAQHFHHRFPGCMGHLPLERLPLPPPISLPSSFSSGTRKPSINQALALPRGFPTHPPPALSLQDGGPAQTSSAQPHPCPASHRLGQSQQMLWSESVAGLSHCASAVPSSPAPLCHPIPSSQPTFITLNLPLAGRTMTGLSRSVCNTGSPGARPRNPAPFQCVHYHLWPLQASLPAS